MLSIVIQTLNEENYLPLLLASIKRQHFHNYEIIVSDAGSKDNTREIAGQHNCQIVKGGFPPIGKNEGAKIAQGDMILFIDADTVLDDDSLEKFLKEFKIKNLDVATFLLKSEGKFHNLSCQFLYNLPSLLTAKFLPQAMNIILARKDIHQKVGGFDEGIKLGEELDYVRKIAKIGRFDVLKSAKIFVSPRRFKQDGWLTTWLKYFLCQLHMIFFGSVKSDIFRYRFNHYSKNLKNQVK
ncbi:glycosyltransferase [Patescibacteria group bacterium]|nr:glycosyltransferase [Patescibacteria group bacterium]